MPNRRYTHGKARTDLNPELICIYRGRKILKEPSRAELTCANSFLQASLSTATGTGVEDLDLLPNDEATARKGWKAKCLPKTLGDGGKREPTLTAGAIPSK